MCIRDRDAAGNAVAEATGLEISLDENEKDFTYDAATATLTWKGTPTGTVYTHDVNLNITYTHNWGVVTKTFKVTCLLYTSTKKSGNLD